jgi:Tol biopolymer transport system component
MSDGHVIAFGGWQEDWVPGLFLHDLDPGEERLLLSGVDVEDLRPSPDGRWLALNTGWDMSTIELLDISSGGKSTLGCGGRVIDFLWSPDGSRLAVIHSRSVVGPVGLVIHDLAGGRVALSRARVTEWSSIHYPQAA